MFSVDCVIWGFGSSGLCSLLYAGLDRGPDYHRELDKYFWSERFKLWGWRWGGWLFAVHCSTLWLGHLCFCSHGTFNHFKHTWSPRWQISWKCWETAESHQELVSFFVWLSPTPSFLLDNMSLCWFHGYDLAFLTVRLQSQTLHEATSQAWSGQRFLSIWGSVFESAFPLSPIFLTRYCLEAEGSTFWHKGFQ